MSNSTAMTDGRKPLPVMMAGAALRESTDPNSLCCFLPSSSSSSKAQSNNCRPSGKTSQKSQTGASSTGQALFRFWKSHSDEGSRKRGEVRTSQGSQSVNSSTPTAAKQSLSCDESSSSARLRSHHPAYASPSVMDGILSSLQNRRSAGHQDSLEVLDSLSSGRGGGSAELQSPAISSQISNYGITTPNGSSCEQLSGGRTPFNNKPPVKTFALDPTKYQLRSSERRNVPQMGRQRRNCSTNDSICSILPETDYSNEDVISRDNTGLCGSQQMEVASNKQNGGIIARRDSTMTPSQPRAQSLGCESGVAGHRSSLASVSRHLSLETEACEQRLPNVTHRDQDAASSKLMSWMSGPESPDYAIPFDTLVGDLNVVRNSPTAVILPRKAGRPTGSQALRTSSRTFGGNVTGVNVTGVNVTGVNEGSITMMKPQLIDDTSISLTRSGSTKSPFHWTGDRPADKSNDDDDTLKARSPGICLTATGSSNWEARHVADRSIANLPPPDFKSSHPESMSPSQNPVIDPSGQGHLRLLLSKGPNCAVPASWNQSVPDLHTSRGKNDKSTSASGSVNKISNSVSKEPNNNNSRIQDGQLMNGCRKLDFHEQPRTASEGTRHFSSSSTVEDVSNLYRMPDAMSPGRHLSNAKCQIVQNVEQFKQRSPIRTQYTTPWDNVHVTEYSSGVNPSESIASDLRDLFRSSDSISVPNRLRHDFQSSSTCGTSSSRRSDASTETLRNFEENIENDVARKGNNPSIANDPYGRHSCFFDPQISYDHDRSYEEVFDQNNNEQFFDDEDDDEEEFFGTSAGSTLDWCYKWEWDSPTSTLQRSVIRRPAFQRNNSVIPLMNNQTKQNTDSSTTPSQESNPDVIPMIVPPPRLLSMKNRGHNFPGAKICYYIVSLASESEFFGAMVKNFIQCTVTGVEMNPSTVMRNIRQCIDGLKNYLMQQRDAKLNEFIKLECSKINSGEFLNMDAITERALHKCIIRPLHGHIYKLFVYDFTRNGNLQRMADGIKTAKAKRIFERSGSSDVISHQSKSVQAARHFLRRMTETYSPIKKLENLIAAVSMIAGNDTICSSSNQTRWSAGNKTPLRTDELLLQLMHVLVDQEMTSAEVEADYIWGLIHPSFLTGERTYCLTMFSSAVALIKNLTKSSSPTTDNCLQRISADGLLRICIPDEKQDNIWMQTLPFQPNMTTTDICQMMAYKLSITNPHEYSLYLINDGQENRLNDTANLTDVKTTSNSNHLLAYKRISAKFIWPKSRR